jgi:hypothetical protein
MRLACVLGAALVALTAAYQGVSATFQASNFTVR